MGPITSACCDNDNNNAKGNPKRNSPPNTSQNDYRKKREQATYQSGDIKLKQLSLSSIPTKQISEKEQTFDDIEGIEKILRAPNKKMRWSDFTISYLIGSGGFGQVFLGELNSNRTEGIIERYAIKRIKKTDVVKKRLTESIRLQKKILEESSCKFITRLYFAFRDDFYLYIVMEWAEGGDTYSFIKNGSPRAKPYRNNQENCLRFILGCLILGLEYLHSKQIIYRDLKPENLLLFSDGYVKLTDFGLARELKENQFTKTLAGTTIYYAPQMVLGEKYGREIDLWTLGVYSYEMSNFAAPFAGADIKNKIRVKKLVLNAEKSRIWKIQGLSLELKSFINELLKFDPKKRLGTNGWKEVKEHDFFKCANFDWSALENQQMQSPLKSILTQFKIGYTPYDPAKMDLLENQAPPQLGKDLIPSWSVRQSYHYT